MKTKTATKTPTKVETKAAEATPPAKEGFHACMVHESDKATVQKLRDKYDLTEKVMMSLLILVATGKSDKNLDETVKEHKAQSEAEKAAEKAAREDVAGKAKAAAKLAREAAAAQKAAERAAEQAKKAAEKAQAKSVVAEGKLAESKELGDGRRSR